MILFIFYQDTQIAFWCNFKRRALQSKKSQNVCWCRLGNSGGPFFSFFRKSKKRFKSNASKLNLNEVHDSNSNIAKAD